MGTVHLSEGATFSSLQDKVFKLALTCELRMCVLQSARLCLGVVDHKSAKSW